MAFGFVSKLQNLWPFSAFKADDLRLSNELVRNLPIPERTKQFVYAVQDPETRSIIYILSAQSLSESSSLDVKCLVREIKPEAVIAQLGVSHGIEVLAEEDEFEESGKNPLPTSSIEVLRRSFVDKVSKESYEDLAGNLVLKEIFGVGFHGHLLEAKKAAKEASSSFLVIESPCLNSIAGGGERDDDVSPDENVVMNKLQGLVNSLIPQQAFGSAVSLSSRRLLLTNDVHLEMVKLLSPHVETAMRFSGPALSRSIAHGSSFEEIRPEESYEAPLFARSIYPLLEDLHGMFENIPSIGCALAQAQKMLSDVNRGESVDGKIISGVYTFRVAVEGLRIALNNAGRLPINKLANPKMEKPEFSELSVQEKSQLLFAQTLRAQTRNFKTTVAVVDASSLAGLRKFWNDPIPIEVKHLVKELYSGDEDYDDETENQTNRKRLLTGKPVVAVGAGATAVLGVSSLSKTVQASTFMKLVTLKLPVSSLKIALAQTQKALSIFAGKTLAPTAKASTALKSAASAEKIRVVAHGVIASAEKTSLSAMRTAFYEIMRKRRVRPIGALPLATFGCSVATCSGLLVYGDGIECMVESVPTAPMVASLGRGVQRLKEVSREVRQTDSGRVQNSIESLVSRLKKAKIQ